MSQTRRFGGPWPSALPFVAPLAFARAGASHAFVLMLFVVLVVVATTWVRGQYVAAMA